MINASMKGASLFFTALVYLIMAGICFGQGTSTNLPVSNDMHKGLEKTITLDADDAFLPSILSILAEKSGFNIVTGPGVNTKERISVHLKDTPISEAINLVVRAAGLSYETVGNSFLVANASALELEIGLAPSVIHLQYSNALEIKELLQDLTEKIQVDSSGNRLLIMASPKVTSEIAAIVNEVDVPPAQILLEARLIEIATDDLDEFGIDWERLSHLTTIIAESPLIKDANYQATGASRAPIENDFGGNLPDLDQLPEQYSFEKIDGLDNVFNFSRQLNAFDITLDFLMKRNKAKVLAHAQLTTLNNREANILIGETLIFAVTSRENAIIVRDSIGIKLSITPTINSDGYITVKVNTEVSSITELIQGLYPRKKIRTASTTVLVKDGQKIFIGGLLAVDDAIVEYKMPLFSNIPIIGKFFTHNFHSTRKTDLLIQITPRIVREHVSYSDAGNLTSQGNMILNEGDIIDMEKLVGPEYEGFDEIKSGVEELEGELNKIKIPLSERLKEQGY